MPIAGRGGSRKRKTTPNVTQRAGAGGSRPANLPPQYNFTPAPTVQVPATEPAQQHGPSTSAPHVRNYPPPLQLFQNSTTQPQHQAPPPLSEEVHYTPPPTAPPQQTPPQSRDSDAPANSHPSSQGNNFQEEVPGTLPEVQEDSALALQSTLSVPNREQWCCVLSPIPKPKTEWFTRDRGSKLVRKITQIFTQKFNAPYYNWSSVPLDKRERLFLEFAKTHHWDPLITGTVQYYFNEIVKRRLKDMVSTARRTREQPPWIGETLWGTMCDYWDTEEAQKRSKTYSKARLSDRNGLGPHVHYSGPKSFQEIQDELEEKMGRPVPLGEVFIQTHTKSDGTYVDQKAEKIALAYEQNVREKLSELEAAASAVSDGSSRPRDLTLDEYAAIFLESTEKDARGNPYGLGCLKETLGSANRQLPGDSTFKALEERLQEAQRQIEE
ncbi:hypothetical protein [Arabidopsis thaliana]|uniref:Uncharacterized protein F8A12.27 n=1 Tax=Arabidopsis thaliana TaxID=3702 RepID=Q9C6J4_ARATH|nr:hypothetical protein [Arabidopsis thaliana]